MNGADLPWVAAPVASEAEAPAAGSRALGASPAPESVAEAPPAGSRAPGASPERELDAKGAVIQRFIHDAYLPAEPLDSLDLDLDLIESGILDSLGVVEVADFLEEQSGMPVATEELTRSNIGTIAAMAGFVIRRRAFVER